MQSPSGEEGTEVAEEQTSEDRLSKDDWYVLGNSDPQAARQAYQDGKVDLPPWLADELQGSNDHFKLLGALDQSLQRAADAQDEAAPDPKQAQQLSGEDEPERPLPDSKIDMDHWHYLARDDHRYAQRIFDAGLVNMPWWIEEELR